MGHYSISEIPMKKLLFVAALLVSCVAFKSADAQLRISLGLNIGSQPDWGPVGYDHAEYYYLPDIDAYYYVPQHQFVYQQGNQWIHANSLPPRYSNYDLYNGYKVVINQANPWNRDSYYRSHYSGYRGHGGQPMIRDSHDSRYQNHWHGNNGGGRGQGNFGHGNYGNGGGFHGGNGGGRGQGNHGGYNQQPNPGNNGGHGKGDQNHGGNWQGHGDHDHH